jgi:hypothetical protein
VFFTGCDAILEAFYPEFGEDAFGDREIAVEVEFDFVLDGSSKSIMIAVVPIVKDADGNPKIDFEGIWLQSRWDPSSAYFTVNFTPLKEGAYRVFVWYDANGDELPGWDEPSTEASYVLEGRFEEKFLFDFRDSDVTKIDGYAWLSKRDRMEVKFLEVFAPGPAAADYSFRIEGPDTVNKNAPQFFQFFLERNDPANEEPIADVYWGLEKMDRSTISVSDATPSPTPDAQPEFFVNFSSTTPALNVITDNSIMLWVEVEYDNGEMWYEERRLNLVTENYDFFIKGPDVIDAAFPPKFFYQIESNSNVSIANVYWDIVNPYYVTIDFTDTSLKSLGTATDFYIDFNTYAPGALSTYPYDEMIITVDVEYSDGTWWYNERPVMFATEAATGDSYNLDVKIKDLKYDPVKAGSNATYQVEILSSDFLTVKNDQSGNLDALGAALVEFGGLSYTKSPDLDIVYITIDADGDGDADWEAIRDIQLNDGQEFIMMEFISWDFFPY